MKEQKLHMKIAPNFKIWLEYKNKSLFGKGGALLLKNIEKYENLAKAAEKSGLSYRYAWNYLKKVQESLGVNIVKTRRGGYGGGGGVSLTKLGKILLKKYERFEEFLRYALQNPELWEALGLRTTDKNVIEGQVMDVVEDESSAMVKVKMAPPVYIISTITKAATDELRLQKGKRVMVVIKATEAMIETSRWGES